MARLELTGKSIRVLVRRHRVRQAPGVVPSSFFRACLHHDVRALHAREAEPKWQSVWEERELFRTRNDDPRPKYYVLEMFPYPSGRIHMGHVRNYAMGDVVARYKRARGFNVLHPMGWDAFGMPAENAAMANKVHPAEWTYANIATMRRQLKSMGLSLDWHREIATCDPTYYKHQQKMFLDFLAAKLVDRRRRRSTGTPSTRPSSPTSRSSTGGAGARARWWNSAS